MLASMLYRFGAFELDTAKFELRSDGTIRPVEPQVFGLLALLVENRERMVSKDEIVEKVWDGRIVSDAAIASRVKSARQAIGDDGKAQRYIKTLHGQGFRFVAEVRAAHDVQLAEPGAAPPPLPATQASRPSIAVLPFRLVGEPGPYAAIADVLPDDLISELARLRWLFVTARGSSFRLRSHETDVGGIGPCSVCATTCRARSKSQGQGSPSWSSSPTRGTAASSGPSASPSRSTRCTRCGTRSAHAC